LRATHLGPSSPYDRGLTICLNAGPVTEASSSAFVSSSTWNTSSSGTFCREYCFVYLSSSLACCFGAFRKLSTLLMYEDRYQPRPSMQPLLLYPESLLSVASSSLACCFGAFRKLSTLLTYEDRCQPRPSLQPLLLYPESLLSVVSTCQYILKISVSFYVHDTVYAHVCLVVVSCVGVNMCMCVCMCMYVIVCVCVDVREKACA
jgi:hypothetical protein